LFRRVTTTLFIAAVCLGTATAGGFPALEDKEPPTVAIVSPIEGSKVLDEVDVKIIARDNDSGLAKFELYVDSEAVETIVPNLTKMYFTWHSKNSKNGKHVLVVKAYDNVGNIGTSVSVNVETENR
jgi:large repetitive protein